MEKKKGASIHQHHFSQPFKYPFRELFFWAVLNNMQDMALLFWRLGEEHIAKALIANHLCKRLQDKLMNQQDIVKALEESAGKFNEGALQLLDKCYKADDRSTTQMLTCSFNQFEVGSCLNVVSIFFLPRVVVDQEQKRVLWDLHGPPAACATC